MTTRIQKPPASFPFKEAWKSTWTVFTLTPTDGGRHICARRATATAPTKSRSRCAASSNEVINRPSTLCADISRRRRSKRFPRAPSQAQLERRPHVLVPCARSIGRRARRRRDLDLLLGPRRCRALAGVDAFIAWGCHYHSGGKFTGTTKTVVCMSFGAVVGMAAGSSPPGAFASLGQFAAPVAVGLGATVICLASKLPLLGTIPASVYGFASIAGLFLLGSGMSPTRALLPTILSILIGAAFGYVSEAARGSAREEIAVGRAVSRAGRRVSIATSGIDTRADGSLTNRSCCDHRADSRRRVQLHDCNADGPSLPRAQACSPLRARCFRSVGLGAADHLLGVLCASKLGYDPRERLWPREHRGPLPARRPESRSCVAAADPLDHRRRGFRSRLGSRRRSLGEAAFVPALRAARTEPNTVLHYE